ncbi:MAG TPA: UDP-N-acetylmuramoyl-tripeptide--D-alanyl-D-alanine ligase [Thermoanaerobaculia bacterium]|nr:UDP-N-acetylmuramoyl-tripeptide--D-alanyl-D-alanine ligase [Thermoanaerobaculia bacterium]
MPSLTLRQVAEMIGGEVIQGGETVIGSVAIDSHEVTEDSLFFAIRGERLDGHAFLAQALEKALAAVVEVVPHPRPSRGLIRVGNTTEALQSLAREIRRSIPFSLIAVTGSAGKTTTKEMIAGLVATERRTWKSWGNFNNQIGCPLCIANVPDGTDVVVSEMGMSARGEIEFLARLTPPDIGVYTNIRPVHLEFFDSIEGIAAAKRELLENLRPGGAVVVNADDPRVMRISDDFDGPRISYGVASPADYRARSVVERGLRGTRFVLEAEGTEKEMELLLPGSHNLENLLAAIATARIVGVSWEGIERGIPHLRPGHHRGVLVEWHGAMLYDDTYNSNPYALERALELLAAADCPGRRIAVIGDMLELGGDELKFHHDAGLAIPESVDLVIGVGPRSEALLEGAREAGFGSEALFHFRDALEAGGFLRELIGEGDLVLLKASRGIGLDRIVTMLESED